MLLLQQRILEAYFFNKNKQVLVNYDEKFFFYLKGYCSTENTNFVWKKIRIDNVNNLSVKFGTNSTNKTSYIMLNSIFNEMHMLLYEQIINQYICCSLNGHYSFETWFGAYCLSWFCTAANWELTYVCIKRIQILEICF